MCCSLLFATAGLIELYILRALKIKLFVASLRPYNFKRKKEKKQKKKKKRKPFKRGLREGNASFFQKKYYPLGSNFEEKRN
jgi:hypothetical protein